MAKASDLDPRITNFTFDVETDRKVRQQLADAGVNKPEDLLRGQADIGKIGDLMRNQAPDDEISPMVAEKIARDREFANMAQDEPQPQETQAEVEVKDAGEKLAELQRDYEGALAESRKWKNVSGRWKDKASNHEQRLRELETKMTQPYSPYNQQMVPDVRQLIPGRDPNEPLTAQEVVALMMSQSAAFGNELQAIRKQAQEAQKEKERTSAVSDIDEAELLYSHPWLENLQDQQRERAMLDIMASRQASPTPPAPPPPNPNLANAEQMRAKVREANFIESSNRGSRAELLAQDPAKVAQSQKITQLKEALAKPGGSKEAEALLAALGAGFDDNAEGSYLRRR